MRDRLVASEPAVRRVPQLPLHPWSAAVRHHCRQRRVRTDGLPATVRPKQKIEDFYIHERAGRTAGRLEPISWRRVMTKERRDGLNESYDRRHGARAEPLIGIRTRSTARRPGPHEGSVSRDNGRLTLAARQLRPGNSGIRAVSKDAPRANEASLGYRLTADQREAPCQAVNGFARA